MSASALARSPPTTTSPSRRRAPEVKIPPPCSGSAHRRGRRVEPRLRPEAEGQPLRARRHRRLLDREPRGPRGRSLPRSRSRSHRAVRLALHVRGARPTSRCGDTARRAGGACPGRLTAAVALRPRPARRDALVHPVRSCRIVPVLERDEPRVDDTTIGGDEIGGQEPRLRANAGVGAPTRRRSE